MPPVLHSWVEASRCTSIPTMGRRSRRMRMPSPGAPRRVCPLSLRERARVRAPGSRPMRQFRRMHPMRSPSPGAEPALSRAEGRRPLPKGEARRRSGVYRRERRGRRRTYRVRHEERLCPLPPFLPPLPPGQRPRLPPDPPLDLLHRAALPRHAGEQPASIPLAAGDLPRLSAALELLV